MAEEACRGERRKSAARPRAIKDFEPDMKASEVSLAGGDGSSFTKAIVVNAPTDDAGVNAQHDYIAEHFGKSHSMGVWSTISACSTS